MPISIASSPATASRAVTSAAGPTEQTRNHLVLLLVQRALQRPRSAEGVAAQVGPHFDQDGLQLDGAEEDTFLNRDESVGAIAEGFQGGEQALGAAAGAAETAGEKLGTLLGAVGAVGEQTGAAGGFGDATADLGDAGVGLGEPITEGRSIWASCSVGSSSS